MPLTFRQVRYFIATAEVGKVSLAAANLNVSQSAITSAIKSLEEELGAQLFTRKSNGVELTYEGHQFVQHAHNILAAVSEATQSRRRTSENIEGTIEVGVTYTVAGYFLPSILARFVRAFPNVRVNLHERPRARIEGEIVEGKLDHRCLAGLQSGEPSGDRHHTLDPVAAAALGFAGPPPIESGQGLARRCGRGALCHADRR